MKFSISTAAYIFLATTVSITEAASCSALYGQCGGGKQTPISVPNRCPD